MIKLGVTSPAGLEQPFTQLGRRKHASLLLLRDLARRPPADLRSYDRIVERVLMPNGTWRETHAGRFLLLDRVLIDVLRERLPGVQRLTVTDVGASNGTTSLELYTRLRGIFPQVDFLATDLCRDAFAVAPADWHWAAIFEPGGELLQIVFGSLVLPGQGRESLAYPVNHLLRAAARLSLVPRARAVLRRMPTGLQDFECRRVGRWQVIKIPLLSHRCWERTRLDPDFRFDVHDVLRPLPRPAHLVRAMNVLTRVYFDDQTLARAIGNCLRAVHENGGILVTGRSPSADPQEVHATVFARVPGGLEVVSRLNGGCEEEALVLGLAGREPC